MRWLKCFTAEIKSPSELLHSQIVFITNWRLIIQVWNCTAWTATDLGVLTCGARFHPPQPLCSFGSWGFLLPHRSMSSQEWNHIPHLWPLSHSSRSAFLGSVCSEVGILCTLLGMHYIVVEMVAPLNLLPHLPVDLVCEVDNHTGVREQNWWKPSISSIPVVLLAARRHYDQDMGRCEYF